MELRNFAPLNPYLIAEDAPLELITLLSEGSSRGISVKTNVERVYGRSGIRKPYPRTGRQDTARQD